MAITEERLIDLETKITHQDFLIEQMNEVLFRQQTQLDKLEAILVALGKRLQGGEGDFGPGNEKPPHY